MAKKIWITTLSLAAISFSSLSACEPSDDSKNTAGSFLSCKDCSKQCDCKDCKCKKKGN